MYSYICMYVFMYARIYLCMCITGPPRGRELAGRGQVRPRDGRDLRRLRARPGRPAVAEPPQPCSSGPAVAALPQRPCRNGPAVAALLWRPCCSRPAVAEPRWTADFPSLGGGCGISGPPAAPQPPSLLPRHGGSVRRTPAMWRGTPWRVAPADAIRVVDARVAALADSPTSLPLSSNLPAFRRPVGARGSGAAWQRRRGRLFFVQNGGLLGPQQGLAPCPAQGLQSTRKGGRRGSGAMAIAAGLLWGDGGRRSRRFGDSVLRRVRRASGGDAGGLDSPLEAWSCLSGDSGDSGGSPAASTAPPCERAPGPGAVSHAWRLYILVCLRNSQERSGALLVMRRRRRRESRLCMFWSVCGTHKRSPGQEHCW